MKVLVFGAGGQLGQELARAAGNNVDLVTADRSTLDIRDASAVAAFISSQRPAVVFNAAAYTAVDQAESEPELAYAVNADGARNIATACAEHNARLVHFSTDFVFDGKDLDPYFSDSPTGPLGVYGQSKLDGERAVLDTLSGSAVVIRTSWLYSEFGNNFVKTMLRLMRERDSLSVVADQVGSPTWAHGLAATAWSLVTIKPYSGVFHWCDGGQVSWHGFAVAIQEIALEHGLLDDAITIRPIGIPNGRRATSLQRTRLSSHRGGDRTDAGSLEREFA